MADKIELKIDIEYEQLLKLVQQLPTAKIAQLKSDIENSLMEKKTDRDISAFQDFLLKGPVMTDNQYQEFLENRKHFNKWRTK